MFSYNYKIFEREKFVQYKFEVIEPYNRYKHMINQKRNFKIFDPSSKQNK